MTGLRRLLPVCSVSAELTGSLGGGGQAVRPVRTSLTMFPDVHLAACDNRFAPIFVFAGYLLI